MSSRPVLIMAGGTGGHIFPALAVADVLASRQIPLLWLGSKYGMENRLIPERGIRLLRIAIRGLRGKGRLALLLAPFKLMFALLQAIWLLSRFRPRLVLGMGGYVSGPAGLAAWLLRIPLLIHEQNTIAGMTNRLLAPLAKRVLQAFPDTFDGSCKTPVILMGNPVRADITSLPEPTVRLQTETGKLSVLVLGGSLGASALNQTVPLAIKNLEAVELKLVHQTGEAEMESTRNAYVGAEFDYEVCAFIDDMAAAYAEADVVVCRAGALTVSELAAVGIASILVPYPHAVDDHQTTNAQFLVNADAAVMISQNDLTADSLMTELKTLADDPQKRINMACRARDLACVDAATAIADVCLEVAND